MGSKLDHGKVSNGCLVCPYHGIHHGANDVFGKTMVFEDKLWWSYEPSTNKPSPMPYYKNKDFKTIMFTIDMDASIRDCIYNTLDMHHYGYIHNNLLGHTKLYSTEYKFTKLPKKICMNYKYMTSPYDYFSNYQIMNYPYKSTAIISLFNKERLVVDVNMLPLSSNKTKWIVTLKHNFWNSYVQKLKIELIIKYLLLQDKIQMSKQASENMLKRKMMNKYVLKNEEHFKELNKMFKNYEYPDMISVMRLYNYHNNIFDVIP
jgi:phenylpropionate dioxygenase-like ring-hydroxylating dioxygenase large terminal subunit